MDNFEETDNTPAAQKKSLFRRTGEKVRTGVDVVQIVPIQPDEPIIHGWLRAASHKWEAWHGNQKFFTAVLIGSMFYGLYYYFHILVAIAGSLILFLVVPSQWIDVDSEEKKDIIKVRVYRPDDRQIPVDVSLDSRKKIIMQVLKPSKDDENGIMRKKYEEYFFARRLLDPTHPNPIRTPDCEIIDTGYSRYIFGAEVSVLARTVLGEKGRYPAMAMIPLIEESISYINKGLENINRGMKTAKITPEDGSKMLVMAEIAKKAFYAYVNFANAKGVEFVREKDLNQAEKQYVFFMNRITSDFFTQYRDWENWKDIPQSMREARVNSLENMRSELYHIYRYYQMHDKDIRLEEFTESLNYWYESSGASKEAQMADQEERTRQMREIRTRGEVETTKEELTSSE